MKYYKKSNMYKASNVTFNAETFQADSYGWWVFQKRINGVLFFNNYNYSNSTCKHQIKALELNNTLGVKPDIKVMVPCGLQKDVTAIATSIKSHYTDKIATLEAATAKKGSRKSTNAERKLTIIQLNNTMNAALKALGV